MKMKFPGMIFIICLSCYSSFSQNVGIGTATPVEKLEVIGTVKMNALTIVNGGAASDFLIKNNTSGDVAFRKGHTAQAINYIICLEGYIPDPNLYTEPPYLGEIKLLAGEVAPRGWAFCHGQLMSVNSNLQLFALIGNKYGGDGVNTFRLPDLRNSSPVGAGNNWSLGTRSN